MLPPSLTSRERRQLKSRAQHLEPVVKIGKAGLSEALLRSTDDALAHHELIKVRFDGFKEQKHELAPVLAEKTASALVTMVGHVAVLYRKKPEEKS
jgi:RNA-binding protein